uniref:Autophagy-related protein 3 n=1 Tax=Helicotheca tamesis TaxID=374047 RepID=A0A7S2GTA7_9STRA|mmetsp:Transcript_11870/g.16398  ORF Transcript_11870/g.16398 Transcript_11870/m.16398 type:complete len:347 (+) Transcript_11870:310-1350(+)|eukprot:CAMPEP_0185730110 /NCGR_PEP_ID=MMETSP1171-20130828/8551_1 /TAXON_ID=374046 /ORGANISM="Helicotheca tamensis, Strain CCMP826" /LENGTH=346 /DNA_ID=CAMNT_0028399099 /DNA_START=266 /DNA_END=1306 /DNA_ORIENTATION=+
MPSLQSKLRQAREWAYPTLKSSAFLSRGVLTPEEFVIAGDELVYKCPTWSWEGGDPAKAKAYLPMDKQYLVTRNVPCPTRVSALENSVQTNGMDDTAQIDDECGGDDWLVSHILSPAEQAQKEQRELEDGFDILDEDGEIMPEEDVKLAAKEDVVEEEEEEEDEYADMADFEDDNVMEDEAAVTTSTPTETATATGEDDDDDDDNLIKVRTYDLSITYDKYYQTPRVWMMGYAAGTGTSQPLTGEEMMQDVMSDYANRTVTIEHHPHVSGPHASIHPCQHGAVMKTIVRNLMKASSSSTTEVDAEEGHGDGPTIEMYLFIFLKFVSSIIPTINYDFTMDVTASTEK